MHNTLLPKPTPYRAIQTLHYGSVNPNLINKTCLYCTDGLLRNLFPAKGQYFTKACSWLPREVENRLR